MLAKKLILRGSRRHAKTTMISNNIGTLLGPILERFGGPKSNQNRSKIGLKSDHEANAKILKIICRGSVFEDPEIRKAIKNQQKNRLKSHLKLRCQKNTQKCSKKLPTWLQHGLKLGPCWAPKSSWTRPRANKKRNRRRHRKKHQKHTQHKPVLVRNGKRAEI